MAGKFISRLLLFSIPVILFLAALVGLGLFIGDALPASAIYQLQDTSETVLYGGIDNDRVHSFKVNGAIYRQPEFLIVGSSRTHTLGSFIVDDPTIFYNAWIPGMNPEHIMDILRRLDPANLPKIIIWGIDHRFFSPERALFPPPSDTVDIDLQSMVKQSIEAAIQFVRIAATSPETLDNILSHTEPIAGFDAIGIDAQRGRNSLLNSGEAFIGESSVISFLTKAPAQRHAEANNASSVQYIPGDEVDEEKLSIIREALSFAQEHDIMIVAYMPAFSPMSYAEIRDNPDFAYLDQITPTVAPIFEEYGFYFLDLSDASKIPLNDEEFIDGVHLTPRANLRLYRYMLSQIPEVLEEYSSADRIDALLASSDDQFLVDYYRG